MYQDPACKPWNSSGWAPEGYSNREEFETKTKEERASDRLSAATGQAEKGASDEKDSRPSEHRDERAGV